MKLFTFLLCFLISSITSAQLNKGQFLAGGSVSFESIESKDAGGPEYKYTLFSFAPNVGYFIIPKLAAGLRLGISTYKEDRPDNRQTSTSVSPFVRYYLLSQKQKLNVLVDASYVHYRTRYESQLAPEFTEKSNGYNISGGPVMFVNEHVGLEFLIGYKHIKSKDPYSSGSTGTFSTGLGLQVHLGRGREK